MTGNNTEAQVPEQQEQKTFTQEELNKVVQERLKREREKYADYESLKEKASKFDEAEEAGKSELQKALETSEQYKATAEKLTAELDELKAADERRRQVSAAAAEYGVDEGLLARMSGDVAENAKYLQSIEQAKPHHPVVKDAGAPVAQPEPRRIPAII